ncbi:hypothetical protein MM59RIKEN_07760 [Pusillibacter faecalis]|uniref:Uncharacterized protein n=1 Tax=Pusillibacter faecalis TaxID=2714358 RepID=A0A810QB33_9FIRM|nr:hypothetical protein [Pusillibacter faecalis]BCK83457.1 hypothetical protein MM59RIKEN_07760 [Pusillibacter faecalis]
MQYNEIYPLLKNTIKWLQENYPHDTYFVINSNSATMYHKMGIFAMNGVESDNGTNKYTAEQILEITKKAFEA